MTLPDSNKLSNAQLELLKIFSRDLSEQELVELRQVLVKFFYSKLVHDADMAWDENKWSDSKVEELLNTKMRKTS